MASAQRIRFAALALCLALVAGACGGGKEDDNSTSAAKRSGTTSSTDSSLGSDASTTGVTVPGATTTTKKGVTTTTAKGGTGTTAKPAPPPTADPNAVPAPAKNGTYGYSQSGTTPDGQVPADGTLVVSGGSTQSFKRYYDESKSPSTLTYDFRSDGPYITGATLVAQGQPVTCTFGNGVPVPPWPPTPGKTFSGSGTCSNPFVGQLTATISGSVTSRNGDLVGITTNVHVTNANVDVTAHETDSWSISLRVPKSSRQTTTGTAFGQPVNADVTSNLIASETP